MKIFVAILVTAAITSYSFSQTPDSEKLASDRTAKVLFDIAARAFPEINRNKLRVKTFESDSSFFKARYSLCRFATFRGMRHIIYVNPEAFERMLPEAAMEGIIAHELAHVSYYTRKNRFQLLGLVRLLGGSSTASFERKADLDAITRGFGEGLIAYRRWLYVNISPEAAKSKRRNYFSPDEIELIMRAIREQPDLVRSWNKNVPRGIDQIRRDTGYE